MLLFKLVPGKLLASTLRSGFYVLIWNGPLPPVRIFMWICTLANFSSGGIQCVYLTMVMSRSDNVSLHRTQKQTVSDSESLLTNVKKLCPWPNLLRSREKVGKGPLCLSLSNFFPNEFSVTRCIKAWLLVWVGLKRNWFSSQLRFKSDEFCIFR